MLAFFSSIHVVLAVFMIFVILLQPGKDAGMGAALGGGAASSAFGGRGAVTFLSKLTGVCAVAFFVSSLGLSMVSMRTSVTASILDGPAEAAKPSDAAPSGAAPAGQSPIEAAPVGEGTAAPVAPAGVPAASPAAMEKTDTAEAPGKAAAPAQKPGATDAVPADRLPVK
jgi:preprotein translocase subunit SecG